MVAVTVVHEPGEWFEEVLDALGEQDYPNLSLLFLVAGDPADIPARIRRRLPGAFVRAVAGNPGFGPAANQALRLVEGSGFGGLWGGATHPDWRGRGLYRATVAHRARLALASGYPLLRVDASPHSRPILERAGLHQVATTTPYIYDPAPTPA